MGPLGWFPPACVCACVCVLAGWWPCPRLWQSATAPLTPWNWGTARAGLQIRLTYNHLFAPSSGLLVFSPYRCSFVWKRLSRQLRSRYEENTQCNSLNVPWRRLGRTHRLYAFPYMDHLSPCVLFVCRTGPFARLRWDFIFRFAWKCCLTDSLTLRHVARRSSNWPYQYRRVQGGTV